MCGCLTCYRARPRFHRHARVRDDKRGRDISPDRSKKEKMNKYVHKKAREEIKNIRVQLSCREICL